MSESTPTDAREPVIRCRDVVKRFDGRAVIDGVSFDVYRGETLVVMGGSGSGKSTTLRLMIGSLEADGGSIEIAGTDIVRAGRDDLNRVRLKIGVLFQSGALFNSMTLAENVALPLVEHTQLDRDIIDIQVKIKLELVGLREHADKYPSEISGGMKKRAGLARALSLDPQILFYDEPSAGLDPVTSAEIDRLIVDLTKKLGVTSVVITHEMDSAFTIADRMAMLDKGKMLVVEDRAWFEAVRDTPAAEAAQMNEQRRLIRQFLRGDAEGPITARREETNYAEDLMGSPIDRETIPSVVTTRRA
ncbi:MAG TPA: ATP-binding cassette domain-containing protein [Phycisphaerales bacterium]|nr:ATP-binding cassette domain-containing protein [Phycisphaerales bacterium]